jgi:hypothetical protein
MGKLQIKPAQPYRKTISPSSLYKGKCPRCTWLNYWHNFSLPANLALQSVLSRKQEGFFDEISNAQVDKTLAPGTIRLYKGKKTSKPIKVNGQDSRWAFYGELDFVIEYDDGRFGVADGKVSLKADPAELAKNYFNQLHAYAFMLENPSDGDGQKVDTLGLVQWKFDEALPIDAPKWGFSVLHRYIPLDRDDAKFQVFIESFINVIEGDFPDAAPDCLDCKWLIEIGFQY